MPGPLAWQYECPRLLKDSFAVDQHARAWHKHSFIGGKRMLVYGRMIALYVPSIP